MLLIDYMAENSANRILLNKGLSNDPCMSRVFML